MWGQGNEKPKRKKEKEKTRTAAFAGRKRKLETRGVWKNKIKQRMFALSLEKPKPIRGRGEREREREGTNKLEAATTPLCERQNRTPQPLRGAPLVAETKLNKHNKPQVLACTSTLPNQHSQKERRKGRRVTWVMRMCGGTSFSWVYNRSPGSSSYFQARSLREAGSLRVVRPSLGIAPHGNVRHHENGERRNCPPLELLFLSEGSILHSHQPVSFCSFLLETEEILSPISSEIAGVVVYDKPFADSPRGKESYFEGRIPRKPNRKPRDRIGTRCDEKLDSLREQANFESMALEVLCFSF